MLNSYIFVLFVTRLTTLNTVIVSKRYNQWRSYVGGSEPPSLKFLHTQRFNSIYYDIIVYFNFPLSDKIKMLDTPPLY
jgi:hypothetical protein